MSHQSSARDRAESLVSGALSLPHGITQVAMMDEAVAVADEAREVDLGFEMRMQLIFAANYAGQIDKMLVAFTWCIGQYDKDPARFSTHNVMWHYKWAIDKLSVFPQVPRQTIEDSLVDFEKRSLDLGLGLRSVKSLRMEEALRRGAFDEVAAQRQAWELAARSANSDCRACEVDLLATSYAASGDHEKALSVAHPIMQGRMRCHVIPHRTYAMLLKPLFLLGRLHEGAECHAKGWSLIRNEPYLTQAAEHIRFLALTGNLERAGECFERFLPHALSQKSPLAVFEFNLAVWLYFRLLRDAGHHEASLRAPKGFSIYRNAASYSVDDLCRCFEAGAQKLAQEFDARNGNNWFQRQIEQTDELKSQAVQFEVRPPKRNRAKGAKPTP